MQTILDLSVSDFFRVLYVPYWRTVKSRLEEFSIFSPFLFDQEYDNYREFKEYSATHIEIYSYAEHITSGFDKKKCKIFYDDYKQTKNWPDPLEICYDEFIKCLQPYQWKELEQDLKTAIERLIYFESLFAENVKGDDKGNIGKSILKYECEHEKLLPILERGHKAGFLDAEYKPIPKSMTRPQQKRFALLACIEAGLDNYCSRFGQMWGCDYNGVDESRGAAKRREAIDSLFAQDIINKAKLK